jgi:hypothetical protein
MAADMRRLNSDFAVEITQIRTMIGPDAGAALELLSQHLCGLGKTLEAVAVAARPIYLGGSVVSARRKSRPGVVTAFTVNVSINSVVNV